MSLRRGDDAAQGGFPHQWRATILKQRPLILPRRRYVYPREAEEVERGALEVLIEPGNAEPFLATCALGFADPTAPTGVWSCPNAAQLCAVAGGYAYLIDTLQPERMEQVAYRPVLGIHAVCAFESGGEPLLLFVGNQAILGYGQQGLLWETPPLSSEGVEVLSVSQGQLHGKGWDLMSDSEPHFTVDLRTGRLVS